MAPLEGAVILEVATPKATILVVATLEVITLKVATLVVVILVEGEPSEENVSDLERDMQLAFEEQEELLAPSPSSPRRRSFESPPPPIDQDCDRGWSEELQPSSRLCSQDKEKKGPREQEQEMAVDEIRQEVVQQELEEADDDDDGEKREQRGEKQQHQDGGIK